MKIITTRRISQVFFFILFIWLCLVSTLGSNWWQLRGWPINWFMQLDPLVGLGTLLATHTLYAGLLWGLVSVTLTLFVGRFFCGWVCPLGTLQQFVGYLGKRHQKKSQRIQRNQPHRGQAIKYILLIFLIAAAAADLLHHTLASAYNSPLFFWFFILLLTALITLRSALDFMQVRWPIIMAVAIVLVLGIGLQSFFPETHWLAGSLQIGLLDPMVFMHRAVNMVLLPILDLPLKVTSGMPRFYEGAGLIGALFLIVILLGMRVPRFYCRFICPLGALFGLLSRWAVWRVGKSEDRCQQCQRCEADCEGACAPTRVIKISECVLCLNCLDQCQHELMGFRSGPSAAGEQQGPDLVRRQVMTSMVAGLAVVPTLRLGGKIEGNWNPQLVRPPGALEEADFLSRCIKCGQCMRICPTNVVHPAGWQAGAEGIWTPVLNFRIGTSGCQHNCVACSHVCPTAALQPLTVDQRMGRGSFAESGPLRIGMAFVDRGRCLPWAMDTPCIVCQENCPVSPKAIFTREEYQPIRNGQGIVQRLEANRMMLSAPTLAAGQLGSGDYFVEWVGDPDHIPYPIIANTADTLMLGAGSHKMVARPPGHTIEITVRLQKPYVDPHRCIGCGVCQHECPVQGRRAIRVTAENESRNDRHRMTINAKGG